MMNRSVKIMLMLGSGLAVLCIAAIAFAQGENVPLDVQVAEANRGGWIALGAGLGIGLAAFGGSLGQGRAAGSALDGIARNPGARDQIFTPYILGLALIESLVIYALIISILLVTSL